MWSKMQKVTYKGKQYKSLTLACDLLGVHSDTVRIHTKNGMTFEQAVDQIYENKLHTKNSIKCTDHLGNIFESIRCMAISYHLPPTTLYARLNRKWNLKRALTTPSAKPRGKYAGNIQRQKI